MYAADCPFIYPFSLWLWKWNHSHKRWSFSRKAMGRAQAQPGVHKTRSPPSCHPATQAHANVDPIFINPSLVVGGWGAPPKWSDFSLNQGQPHRTGHMPSELCAERKGVSGIRGASAKRSLRVGLPERSPSRGAFLMGVEITRHEVAKQTSLSSELLFWGARSF